VLDRRSRIQSLISLINYLPKVAKYRRKVPKSSQNGLTTPKIPDFHQK
jgi:hypothetical protein